MSKGRRQGELNDMESPNNSTVKGEHNPSSRSGFGALAEREMQTYHQWLDERADDAYRIAEQARQQGLESQGSRRNSTCF